MGQVARTLTMADELVFPSPHVVICDRDGKWSASCGL